MPDYALALMADRLESGAQCALLPDKLLVVADHFAPPATIERAEILRRVQDLCAKLDWPLRLFDGICHQLLVEDARARPGRLVLGSDSHTVTAGALGCAALGFGSTDVEMALLKGRVALRVPDGIKVVLRGELPAGVMGKDIVLEVLRRFGAGRLNYAALEFEDRTEPGISMDNRFSICNMIAEAGGKAALFLPDAVTWAYLKARDGSTEPVLESAGTDTAYAGVEELDVSTVTPRVAFPHNPFNVRSIAEAGHVPIDQVFLGSCNAGRLDDLAVAAAILKNRYITAGVKCIVIPGSRKVYLEALRAGYIEILLQAGVALGQPSCGPCGAIDKGLLAPGERCAATINRNYQGRMGAPDAEIYLVSAASAAAAMATGRLTDPGELL